jgi:hypothetical protein
MQALRRRTALVTGICALVSWSAFWVTGRLGGAALWGQLPLIPLVLIGLGFYVLARLRHVLALLTTAVLLIALSCASASRAGDDDARVFQRNQTQVPIVPVLIGLQLSPVEVSGSPGLPSNLVLLGHTDETYVLASPDALYRVRDSNVLLTQRHS